MFSKLSRIFKNRLTRNVFLFYFGSQIVITGLLLFFIFTYMSRSLADNLKQVIFAQKREMVTLVQKEGLGAIEKAQRDIYLRVLDENHHVLYQALPKEEGTYDLSSLNKANAEVGKPEWFRIDKENDEDDLVMVSELITPNIRLQVGKSTAELNDQVENMLGLFIGIIFPFLLVSFILALILAGRITVQLDEVVLTLQKIKSGQFNERARVDQSELKDIVILFNKMMDQLELLILKNRDELDHFAHDIKTPMTRFKLTAERALIDRTNQALTLQALEEAADAADEITVMISSVFDISLTESGAKRLHKTSFLLREVIEEAVEVYELVASETEITFDLSFETNGRVYADRLQIKRVISNLLDNAVKYSPTGSSIKVGLESKNGRIIASIQDQGIGIPSADLPLVWNRFFRSENAKNHATGYGLGLSFAKAMVEAHEGSLKVESEEGHGASFTMSLPEDVS